MQYGCFYYCRRSFVECLVFEKMMKVELLDSRRWDTWLDIFESNQISVFDLQIYKILGFVLRSRFGPVARNPIIRVRIR